MAHMTALAALLPPLTLVTVLVTRAAARRHSRPVIGMVCALAAFPVLGALIVAALSSCTCWGLWKGEMPGGELAT